ncbi:ankyrin repeat domain-containing protein [Mucilaginibacter paludis]|uniref:Ankyrin n=1 Tax=Mucilaginibacter paludis DSM 18603 TaxID=714943 RepID=H1YA64_9SPHI|nr:ankyrin repeat domain-containing protein [Mucilaginibacter paludis]EHQ25945.1 Ankyrin [Mucilaginibacter paludis DSM 18603]
MKIVFSIIVLVLVTTTSFCQDLNEQLYKAVSNKDSLSVQNLLIKKADANFKKKTGGFLEISMLILAVQNNDLSDVKLLVGRGAEVDWRDAFKTTALMYAANKGNKDIVIYLIKSGADVKAKDEQGNSVLSAAEEGKNDEVIGLIKSLVNKK